MFCVNMRFSPENITRICRFPSKHNKGSTGERDCKHKVIHSFHRVIHTVMSTEYP